jgi:hypothetical protein
VNEDLVARIDPDDGGGGLRCGRVLERAPEQADPELVRELGIRQVVG